MCEAILDAVERRAAGRSVAGVRLRIGALHQVVPSALDQAFSLASAGTVAEGADVDLVVTPAVVTCRSCEARTESAAPYAGCARCGSPDVEIHGGDELVLESIRVTEAREEVPDVPRDPR